MGGRMSRNKGAGFERECVKLFQEAGLAAERVPLSGAAGGSFRDDVKVSVPVLNADKHFECKRRARGFTTIYNFLGDAFGLIIRDDHAKPLVVLPFETFARMALGNKSDSTQAVCVGQRGGAASSGDDVAAPKQSVGSAQVA